MKIVTSRQTKLSKTCGLALMLFVSLFILLVSTRIVSAANTDPIKLLIAAVNDGDAGAVKKLLSSGGDPNLSPEGLPLISRSAELGDLGVVEALVAGKADVNLRDDVSLTPLMHAAKVGHSEIVKLLLREKADFDAESTAGESALLIAAKGDRFDIVQLLLNAGANPNRKNLQGEYAVMIAARETKPELIQILAAGKADLNQADGAFTPLTYAIGQQNVEIVKALIKAGADVNKRAPSGDTPLQLAVESPEISQILKDSGAK